MEFGRYGSFAVNADYYRIYTWKGYEGKDLDTADPLYLNAQGDKGNAVLLVVCPRLTLAVGKRLFLDLAASYYWRHTYYKFHDNVTARTFDVSAGLMVRL